MKCRTTKIEHRSNCIFDFQKVLNLHSLLQWSEGLGCFETNVAECRMFFFPESENKQEKLKIWKINSLER